MEPEHPDGTYEGEGCGHAGPRVHFLPEGREGHAQLEERNLRPLRAVGVPASAEVVVASALPAPEPSVNRHPCRPASQVDDPSDLGEHLRQSGA